ncbi:MAG TPA: MauE/DoxX family redox-associated membrane protein [Planctomycetaceae bacterium]|nr:MauE/DoxX family redox-associated membrane protein [Planctomycetaceae bacterium]
MRIFKTVSRYVFAMFFVAAGILHFKNPDFYLKIMPPYVPLHLEMVYLSGVAEILLGAMLMFSDVQRLAGWGLISLLIAVFPANIYAYQHQELLPAAPLLHLLRLPLQGLLILWAYWYTRPDRLPPVQPVPAEPQPG